MRRIVHRVVDSLTRQTSFSLQCQVVIQCLSAQQQGICERMDDDDWGGEGKAKAKEGRENREPSNHQHIKRDLLGLVYAYNLQPQTQGEEGIPNNNKNKYHFSTSHCTGC